MVAVRRYLALLVAFGLAISPVSVAVAKSIVPAFMSMEDCDHGQTKPAPNEPKQNKKQCPGCDRDGQCMHSGCMSACAQQLIIVGELCGFRPTSSTHIKPTVGKMRAGREIQPQPPPPRA